MKAEILSTGDEIRSGALADTNAAYIAQQLEFAGIEVVRHNCVGDDINILVEILKEISIRADICLVTGGLGPTSDDLTAEAVAKAANIDLIPDEKALSQIQAYFNRRQRVMSDLNKKQAFLPKGCQPLYNPVGTAPGFMLKISKCVFFFMPGVPFEMKKMLSEQVLPKIGELRGENREFCLVKTISTFGLPESLAGELVADLSLKFPGTKLGLRAKFPEIQVKIYANGKNEKELNELTEKARDWAVQKLGNKVFSFDEMPMEAVVGNLLRQKKATIAVAESCTGGLISHLLTNISGSSDYFLFSAITYSNETKIKVLGVSDDILNKYGAVHEETAKQMAEGVRRISSATYGLATSGIAGPTGGTPEKPVGTVSIGLATPEDSVGRLFKFQFDSRIMNKKIFAMAALDLLRRELLKCK